MKIFNHVKLPSLEFNLKQVNSETGRTYLTPDGKSYPSITTVLSNYNKRALMEWRERVGAEEANRISKKASNRGTKVHDTIEKYLLNESNSMRINSLMPDMKEMFNKIRPYLDKHVGTIYGIEQPLYSDALKISGTCDCIAEWDGVLSIIDWKTSNYHKEESYIGNYFMQTSAYAEMFEERTGTSINQVVVAIAVENEEPQIFIKKKEDYLEELKRYIDKYHLTNQAS
jgi:genome maintenance exonuclease 1